MNQEHYNVFHEGKSMEKCSKCGSFLDSINQCPSCD